jgi:putative ABC transport system substrate-binding protein
MPLFAEEGIWVDAGALMSYATNESIPIGYLQPSSTRYSRKPADPPVEQPMKFELVINLKAAKQIGQTIKPNALARAN